MTVTNAVATCEIKKVVQMLYGRFSVLSPRNAHIVQRGHDPSSNLQTFRH